MKKLLITAFAFVSFAGVSAYSIKIDNDADGKQATRAKVTMKFTGNFKPQMFELGSGRERTVRRIPDNVRSSIIMVEGLSGMGKGQKAFFRVPKNLAGKNITVDIEVENGRLTLMHDKNR